MNFLTRHSLAALYLLGALLSASAHANVVISGTRVIYPAEQREVSVKLTNEGDRPALMQAWIDSGNANESPEESAAPFMLTPPLARVEPGKGQTLRLVYLKEPLPVDRESVFYLNVLDIPPSARPGDEHNQLQVAFRTRIKIFFRPSGLHGDPDSAAEQLTWKLIRESSGAYTLECQNTSPYHVSLTEVRLQHGGQTEEGGVGMVAPNATFRFALKGLATLPTGPLELHYTSMNDYGAGVPHQTQIMP
ncbi:fimbrial biogenesis chaperone [Ralstonia holmesii]|uniref:Fimbrial chaperone YadV n=1 Tax=Ralstonia holmesii TaxID=3058602 RepID=A0ABC8QD34_9RALS|nr:fimbria/pilus periplasmic chaperone [Ralstonia sp. LMG 32967]CAJ0793674.1 putative fimbrial chaperone YadV [Ralstonia sp. LMG 32967]CAJ0819193.1 putative fimbrial chaperone YadV [Ralstonia sp. LMG 32967]